MKSKELIKQLQELDPEGECQVFAGGDIFCLMRLPWFYDGKPGILLKDETRKDEYNVVGVRQIAESDGDKIYIYDLGLDDLSMDHHDNENFTVDGRPEFKARYEKFADYWNLTDEEYKTKYGKEKD